MSNQDYISRTPSKKKKNSPYKKKSAEPAPKLPVKTKLISLLILLLVATFSYGLWFLKTSPTTKEPIKIISPVAVKEEHLPEPPKEKWTYVENLKTKEVEVGQYEVKQNGPYKMQCGSFRTNAQAESVKAKMAFVGLESKIQMAKGKTSTWYKVVLGPYPRKRTAEQDKHKLRKNNINDCQIWLWRD